MAQSVHGESPPGVGGGGNSYFKYKRRTVRPTDSYEHPRMGFFKRKRRRSVQILHPVDKVEMYFSQNLTTKKCTAT